MALTIGEANAASFLVHLLQGDTHPHGIEITPARAALSVETLVPKIHKALMAGPAYDEHAVRRTTEVLALLPQLVDDLVRMDADTGIDITRWPNAARLVELIRPPAQDGEA